MSYSDDWELASTQHRYEPPTVNDDFFYCEFCQSSWAKQEIDEEITDIIYQCGTVRRFRRHPILPPIEEYRRGESCWRREAERLRFEVQRLTQQKKK